MILQQWLDSRSLRDAGFQIAPAVLQTELDQSLAYLNAAIGHTGKRADPTGPEFNLLPMADSLPDSDHVVHVLQQ
ncbi:MAG: hypothetical protein ACOH2I_07230 [Pseudomonas sp.]